MLLRQLKSCLVSHPLQSPRPIFRPSSTYNYRFKTANMSTQVITDPSRVALASIDLSGYDPEQSKLMEERCIVVDENDKAVGCADKKTCTPVAYGPVPS